MTLSLTLNSAAERTARELAAHLHAGQSWGPFPYLEHLDRVYACLAEACQEDALKVAAYLHDALEDTAVTRSELDAQFGSEVGWLVDAVSGFGPTRDAKQRCIVAKLRAYPKAIPLKMADRIVNMQLCIDIGHLSLLTRYRQEDLEPGYGELFRHGPEALRRRYEALLGA